MSHSLVIPTVTEADLLDFHARSFGAHFKASTLASLVIAPTGIEEEDNEDDGLGYYPDGVKRTLTDEQIEIFRHSELHALRQEEERRARDKEAWAEDKNKALLDDHSAVLNTSSKLNDGLSDGEEEGELIDGNGGQDSAAEEEAEYAMFLEKERAEFERAAAAQRKKNQDDAGSADRTISTRRRVREMDSYGQQDFVLDYDEGPGEAIKSQVNADTEDTVAPATGRKIWWPEILT